MHIMLYDCSHSQSRELTGHTLESFMGPRQVFLANGSEFHGFFRDGRMNGRGTYTYADGSRFSYPSLDTTLSVYSDCAVDIH
jgi:hypothetical protein